MSLATKTDAVPDLIRDLNVSPIRGPGSSPGLRYAFVNRGRVCLGDGLLHLHRCLQIQHGDLHRRNRRSAQAHVRTQIRTGQHAHGQVSHSQIGLFRDARNVVRCDRAREEAQTLAPRMERCADQRTKSKLVRLDHGGLVSLRSRIKSGTALH